MHPIEINSRSFGTLPDGTAAQLFELKSRNLVLTLTTFGARVVSLLTRDRDSKFADIALGYSDVKAYATGRNVYLGATIGRVANRIANGQFLLNGVTYRIPVNNGANALHGGPVGFDQRSWQAEVLSNGVRFTLATEDGDQGFPGTMKVSATYILEDDSIVLQYRAEADQPTVVNLTNHTYFNLSGEGAGTILGEELTIHADSVTPINDLLIPTGETMDVFGTPFDFTSPAPIGSRIQEAHPQLLRARGYDHNFVLRGTAREQRQAARVHNRTNGRVLEVFTTQPGVQFYSGNFLDGSLIGKRGQPYAFRSGFCLETQHFPDSPNHPEFPSCVLRPGDRFESATTWRFSHD